MALLSPAIGGCADDSATDIGDSSETTDTDTTPGDGDGDSSEVGTASGDGDGDTAGDGDGDPAGDGDGDMPGDGDGDMPGDGDGDMPGDGDGDMPGDGDGDMPGDGDGDMPGDGDGDMPGDGDGDMPGDGDGDMPGDGDGDMVEPGGPPWLLSIHNATHTLQKVDIFTGQTEDVCVLNTNDSYPSLTFSRNNLLYASRGGSALDVIDPCTCEVTQIGSYNGFTGVNGITADNGVELRGVATTQDDAISIDTDSGAGLEIGPLGTNFGTAGATWTDEFDGMWAINGNDDWLYQINSQTGEATQHVALDYNFGTVGIELSAFNEVIYACSSAGDLLSVDPETGEVTIIGDMGNVGSCTNLAAPFEPLDCIDNL